jgi:type VI protein secretion system component Hcp
MDIVLKCNITGECAFTVGSEDLEDSIEAIGIHDFVRGYDSGSSGGVRGIGGIQLVRHRDRASRELAQACASGTELAGPSAVPGTVTLYILGGVAGARVIHMKYEMEQVYVSRYECGTADAKGVAYRRHSGSVTEDLSPMGVMWHAVKKLSEAQEGETSGSLDSSASSGVRFSAKQKAMPTPLYDEYASAVTDTEIERVWLSPKKVRWTYSAGNITGSFDNITRAAWAEAA